MKEPFNNLRIKTQFWTGMILTPSCSIWTGPLLDKYFDDYFWEHYVPLHYAEKKQPFLPTRPDANWPNVTARLKTLLSGTDLDYWTGQLGLDIVGLKLSIRHLITVHPFVLEFLEFIRGRKKRIILVTAAHRKNAADKDR